MASVKCIKIEFGFYILTAAFLLLLPLKLVVAWSLAVIVHETSHYIALRLFDVGVLYISLGATGISMQIGEISGKRELICALSGPLGSLSLLMLGRWLPCTAICGFVQCLFNLLPIYPLDGGRALRCLFVKLFGNHVGESISKWISCMCSALIILSIFVLEYKVNLGGISIMLLGFTLIKFKLANKANK